jgi:membrane dipeptidase
MNRKFRPLQSVSLCVLASLLGLAGATAQSVGTGDPALAHAKQLLARMILVDGHNDLPRTIRTDQRARGNVELYDLRHHVPGQTDIARLKQGGIGAQFWSVYVPGELTQGHARMQLEQIDIAKRVIARYPETLRSASTVTDVRAAHRNGRIASLLGIEGGHVIENSLGVLRAYYDLGVRYMTLTHNTHTQWADSASQLPPEHGGLTEFGEQVVLEMNRLGMLVDLSHTSVDTMKDALRVAKAPVIFSHSAARALCDVPRNVPDDVLRSLRDNGGVIMVTFVAPFLDPQAADVVIPAMTQYNLRSRAAKTDEERQQLRREIYGTLKVPPTPIGKVADHIEHIRAVAGVEHVGIGSDFDGSLFWPEGLSDVSMYPNLFAELIRRGWSDHDLELLAGENLLRALAKAEQVAARLRATPAVAMASAEVGESASAMTATATGLVDDPLYEHAQRLVDVGGRKMNLYCVGSGTPAVILESGLADPTVTWAAVQPALARKTRVCSYDRAGIGFSESSGRASTSANAVEDLHALLRAASIRPPYLLVGHSLGGSNVRLYAYRHPSEVAGMVLIDPAHEDQVARYAKVDATAAAKVAERLERHRFCVEAAAKGIPTATATYARCIDPPTEQPNAYFSSRINASLAAIQAQLPFQAAQLSEYENASSVSADQVRAARRSYGALPLIVLTREAKPADATTRAGMRWQMHEELAALSTRGEHRAAPQSGHYIQFERPDLVLAAIADALAEAAQP